MDTGEHWHLNETKRLVDKQMNIYVNCDNGTMEIL